LKGLTVESFDQAFPANAATTGDLDDVELARSQEYALLSSLLAHAPDQALLERLAGLRGDASPLGLAHAAVAEAASRVSAAQVDREFFNLFIGLGRGELLPYGSYYLTGFLHERRSRACAKTWFGSDSNERRGQAEPEDHAAILCEVMAGLVSRRFPAAPGDDREFFERHLLPWIGRFFIDLERAETADFYRRIGTFGRAFVDMETEAFALPT
jgi:TorA maturation chaperone TorD